MTQSAEDAATAVETRIASPERTVAIGNGVDLSRFCPPADPSGVSAEVRREFGFEEACPLALMQGRVVKEKGYPDLLEAWKRVHAEIPGARLLCVGPELESDRAGYAVEAGKLAAQAEFEGSIRFAGFREDIPRLMQAADLFVLPSWREGMPRSIIEAMASGLPVVASRIRGSREEVIDGDTGLLVPPHDPRALSKAMIRLFQDEALRRRLGKEARIRAETEFDEWKVIEAQREIYRTVCEEKGVRWPET